MSSGEEFETCGTTSAAKDASFKDCSSILLSHVLRHDNSDNLEEGKEILQAIGHSVGLDPMDLLEET